MCGLDLDLAMPRANRYPSCRSLGLPTLSTILSLSQPGSSSDWALRVPTRHVESFPNDWCPSRRSGLYRHPHPLLERTEKLCHSLGSLFVDSDWALKAISYLIRYQSF